MSRKAGTVSEETKKNLIKAAENEFSEYGYEKASLRRICANAQVTTGAVYFFYKNKLDLFRQVISPVFEKVENVLQQHDEIYSGKDKKEVFDSTEEEDYRIAHLMIDYYCENNKLSKIIIQNVDHPLVKEYLEAQVQLLDAHMEDMFHLLVPDRKYTDTDRYMIHWCSHLKVEYLVRILSQDRSRKEMDILMEKAIRFLRQGFLTLLD